MLWESIKQAKFLRSFRLFFSSKIKISNTYSFSHMQTHLCFITNEFNSDQKNTRIDINCADALNL